jgi:polyamine oxidase
LLCAVLVFLSFHRQGYEAIRYDDQFSGSNIIFVTLVNREAYRAEHATDEETQAEALAVLAKMFPDITIPEQIAFAYPRWTQTPWSYGSYSNWPPGTTLEMHQNFRANVDRLWFAGEATSAAYFGYMQKRLV